MLLTCSFQSRFSSIVMPNNLTPSSCKLYPNLCTIEVYLLRSKPKRAQGSNSTFGFEVNTNMRWKNTPIVYVYVTFTLHEQSHLQPMRYKYNPCFLRLKLDGSSREMFHQLVKVWLVMLICNFKNSHTWVNDHLLIANSKHLPADNDHYFRIVFWIFII